MQASEWLTEHVRSSPRIKWCAACIKYWRELIALSNHNSNASSKTGHSVLVFTVHKCASTYLPQALAYLNQKYMKLNQLDLAGCIWNLYSTDVYGTLRSKQSIFHQSGYMYVPLREPLFVPNGAEYRSIVMLRDPRDVVVSHYYSIAYSHNLPANISRRREMLNERARLQKIGLSAYVNEAAPAFREVYDGYITMKEQNVKVLKYEDMISNFPYWARELASGLELRISDEDVHALYGLSGSGQSVEENVQSHIRQREPGDHRKKLGSESIRYVNEIFTDSLTAFGYT